VKKQQAVPIIASQQERVKKQKVKANEWKDNDT
jgi:hypothetical protein